MADVPRGRVLTGARIRFIIDGKTIAYTTSITIDEELRHDPVEPLDDIRVAEHVPTGYTTGFTASYIRRVEETIRSLGLFPLTGQSSEDHLRNVLNHPDLVAQANDRKTGLVVYRVTGVRLTTRRLTIGARGMVTGDLTFVGIATVDEVEA